MPVNFAKIRALREQQKLTMEEAAQRAGFGHRQRWYEFESGRRNRVYVDQLEKIAAVLGVRAGDLLADDDPQPPAKQSGGRRRS